MAGEAGLTEADIIEVIGSVVANIFTNHVNHVAETEIDFPVVKAAASARRCPASRPKGARRISFA